MTTKLGLRSPVFPQPASYVAGPPPDARPLDRGQPQDEDTEGGTQLAADESLINRRLSAPPPALCSTSRPACFRDNAQSSRSCTPSALNGNMRD